MHVNLSDISIAFNVNRCMRRWNVDAVTASQHAVPDNGHLGRGRLLYTRKRTFELRFQMYQLAVIYCSGVKVSCNKYI